MPQPNCDTGRVIYAKKRDVPGRAKLCDRCKGWHDVDDRPKSRAGRKARQVDNRPKDLQ